MLKLKDFFVYLISIITFCIFLITLHRLGVNPDLNLYTSAFIYGCFNALYFAKAKIILPLVTLFYSFLFFVSFDIKIALMVVITFTSYFLMKMLVRLIKSKLHHQDIEFNRSNYQYNDVMCESNSH